MSLDKKDQSLDLERRIEALGTFVVNNVAEINIGLGDLESYLLDVSRIIPNKDELELILQLDEAQAIRILGDLGMIALSLTIREVDINTQFPDLVSALLALSEKTGLPPRDNYYAYANLNFTDERKRHYTLNVKESEFIDLIKGLQECFGKAINAIKLTLAERSWDTQTALESSRVAAEAIEAAAMLMLRVRNEIPPETFFASRDVITVPIQINGAQWRNPKGEITSLITNNNDNDSGITLLDLLLYGTDEDFDQYLQCLYPSYPYSIRAEIGEMLDPSFKPLAVRFQEESNEGTSLDTKRNLLALFRQMYRWRAFHNSATTTHLRVYNKAKKKEGKGFEYDDRLFWLLNRSKSFFDELSLIVGEES